jgi:CHAT domain-containing protein
MKKVLLIFLSLSCCYMAFSQNLVSDTTFAGKCYREAKTMLDKRQFNMFDSILIYSEKSAELYSKHKIWKGLLGSLCNQIQVYARNGYEEQVILLKDSIGHLSTKYYGENNLYLAEAYHYLGFNYNLFKKIDQAIENFNKAIEIRRQKLGETNPTLALSFANLAVSYANKNDHNFAISLFKKAKRIYLDNYTDKNSMVAYCNIQIGKCYQNLVKIDSAIFFINEALVTYKSIFGENNASVAESYSSLSDIYDDNFEFDKALELTNKSLDINMRIFGEQSKPVYYNYYSLGMIYINKSDFNKSLIYFLKSLDINKSLFGEKNFEAASMYNSIGAIYLRRYETGKALEYFNKSISVFLGLQGDYDSELASAYNNIGITYMGLEEYDLSLKNHFKALEIRTKTLGYYNFNVAVSYNNIGAAYNEKMEFDSAEENLFKSRDILLKIYGSNYPYLEIIYANLSRSCLGKSEYDNALDYLKIASGISRKYFGIKSLRSVEDYRLMGDVYLKKSDYRKALEYYHKSIYSNICNNSDSIDIKAIPRISNFISFLDLLKAFQQKADIFALLAKNPRYAKEIPEFKELSKSELYHLSLQNLLNCDTLFAFTRKISSKLDDKIVISNLVKDSYAESIYACINYPINEKIRSKNDLKVLAFNLSEKDKSGTLVEALTSKESLKFAGIPDTLLQKESELKVNLSYFEKNLAESTSNSVRLNYSDKLFELNRSYEELIKKFEKEYPDYFDLKYQSKNLSVKDLQEILGSNTAIRSYFTGDSILYIFTLTKNKLEIQQVPGTKNLNDSILWFRYGLSNIKPSMQETYRRIGYFLFKKLFPDIKTLDKKITNLIIIPDGSLAIIPFECLLTQNYKGDIKDYKAYPYLINKFNISYSYSVSLFYKTFSNEKFPSVEITKLNDWLALAPVFDDKNDQEYLESTRMLQNELGELHTDTILKKRSLFNRNFISPLPSSEVETKTIFKIFDENNLKARLLLHQQANEHTIKSGDLENYKIIHFATHGFVNSEKPELSGILLAQDTTSSEDGILYSGEVYNLKLKADLVVLSACETGLGKIQKGEGIIGLTRALLYAGAKNIIVSLWQVADESTSNLMIDFYKNALENKANMSYSNALRKAKLNMINNGNYSHPFYWSPFILIGK